MTTTTPLKPLNSSNHINHNNNHNASQASKPLKTPYTLNYNNHNNHLCNVISKMAPKPKAKKTGFNGLVTVELVDGVPVKVIEEAEYKKILLYHSDTKRSKSEKLAHMKAVLAETEAAAAVDDDDDEEPVAATFHDAALKYAEIVALAMEQAELVAAFDDLDDEAVIAFRDWAADKEAATADDENDEEYEEDEEDEE